MNFGPWPVSYDKLRSLWDLIFSALIFVQFCCTEHACQNAIDLIFVLDSSGSIGRANYQKMLEFVGDVINKLDIGPDKSRVGVVDYSNSASVPIHLNAYQMNNTLLNAVAGISYNGGSTNTADGITTCIQEFNTAARPKWSGIPRIAIVVTDGQSDSPPDTIAAAQSFHSANILSYAVGIGSVDMEELNSIASDPASQHVHILSAFNIKELQALQETLNNEACTGEYL